METNQKPKKQRIDFNKEKPSPETLFSPTAQREARGFAHKNKIIIVVFLYFILTGIIANGYGIYKLLKLIF